MGGGVCAAHVGEYLGVYGFVGGAVVAGCFGPEGRAGHGAREELLASVAGGDGLRDDAAAAGALAPDGDVVFGAAEVVDVFLDPEERGLLVEEARVEVDVCGLAHFGAGEEAEDVGAVIGVHDDVVVGLADVQHREAGGRDGEFCAAAYEAAAVERQQHRSKLLTLLPRAGVYAQVQTVLGSVDGALRTHVKSAVGVVRAIGDGCWGLGCSEAVLACC